MIVGAGPAGFAASLAAIELGLKYATIEQVSLGGAVAHYPRGKLVMTAPARPPVVSKFHFRETAKEKLLDFWRGIEKDTGVQINYDETVESISKKGDYFVVKTSRAREFEIENDTVIVNAGGILPTGFLRSLGIQVDTKFGTV